MNSSLKLAGVMGCLFATLSAVASTNLTITSFNSGMLSFTNIDSNLYYTVEWRPALTGTNDWSGSFRGCQDLRSTNDIITVPVPVFYRILGTSNPVHTLTLSGATATVASGYYDATDLTEVDTDLISANIKSGTTIFGVSGKTEVVDTTSGDAVAGELMSGKKAWVDGAEVTGTLAPARVPKTGQTTRYNLMDGRCDGDLRMGVPWPTPRFTNNGNGTVTDNLTGLVWTRSANIFSTEMSWETAVNMSRYLYHGQYGLTDGSSGGDWRLPNVKELLSLIDFEQINPALPSGHPFVNLPYPGNNDNEFHSSTTYKKYPTMNLWVDLDTGGMMASSKGNLKYAIFVRNGP